MTGLGTSIASALAAGLVAAGGLVGAGLGSASGTGSAAGLGSAATSPRTALVVDAALGRDGRELVAPRLRDLHAELRLPRTTAEAETDLRYFAAQGYRLVVAGPDSKAAAEATRLPVSALRR
jgi:hypothetical protein